MSRARKELAYTTRAELPQFYRRLGYEEVGTEPFPEPERTKIPCQFVVMSKPLA